MLEARAAASIFITVSVATSTNLLAWSRLYTAPLPSSMQKKSLSNGLFLLKELCC